MNQTEKRYSELLDRRSDVSCWFFEEVTFKLGPDCRFCPDFLVLLEDGSFEAHEVKGTYCRDDALVKFRVAAGRYPLVFRLAVWDKNTWKITTPHLSDR
jgi:hypothetical protein